MNLRYVVIAALDARAAVPSTSLHLVLPFPGPLSGSRVGRDLNATGMPATGKWDPIVNISPHLLRNPAKPPRGTHPWSFRDWDPTAIILWGGRSIHPQTSRPTRSIRSQRYSAPRTVRSGMTVTDQSLVHHVGGFQACHSGGKVDRGGNRIVIAAESLDRPFSDAAARDEGCLPVINEQAPC